MNVAILRAPHALVRILSLSALALTLAGCKRVKPEELTVELAKLRQEMRTEITQGDQKVATDLGARVDDIDARLTTLANELNQLGDEFDVTVERMEGAIRFSAPVFFEFADATIREADRPVLDRFAAVIREHYPSVLITAEGFTDAAGSRAYNQILGQKRATSVIEYLAQGGIAPTQLRAVSYGEETQRLMDDERGPGGQGLRNRRVVLVIEGTENPVTTTTTETDGAL
jgi:peptidoglycan-associated lipoprotein